MERFKKIKTIGSGTFGLAWLVESLASGRKYAVKELAVSVTNGPDQRAAMNEVRILAQLKHKNIVRYKEAFVDRGKLHIVMEYAEKGDLYTRIKNSGGKYFAEQQVLEWFTQLCLALKYIHSQNILHRDLKTQNIFLTKDDVIKLGDFGIARILDSSIDHAHTAIGTPYYLSPEICQRKPYNHKSDMWSLGCVLYEMTTLKHAFDSDNFSGLVIKIVQGKYPPIPKCYGPLLEDLISVLLRTNPDSRPSAKQILYVPAMKAYVEKFVSFGRERTDSVNSDVSSLSIQTNREYMFSENKETNCVSINASSVKLRAQEKYAKSPEVVDQDSQISSDAYQRAPGRPRENRKNSNQDSSPKEMTDLSFVDESKQHRKVPKSRRVSSTFLDAVRESVFKQEIIITKAEKNVSATCIKPSFGNKKATALNCGLSKVQGCRKQRNHYNEVRHRALSVFDDKITPAVNVRKRVLSEHVQKSTTKKLRERKVSSNVVDNVSKKTGANVSPTKQPEDDKENSVQYIRKQCMSNKIHSHDSSQQNAVAHPFQSHNYSETLVTRDVACNDSSRIQAHARSCQSRNQIPVTQDVIYKEAPGIRKRTYTISSDRRESQFGQVPGATKDKMAKICRSKSESDTAIAIAAIKTLSQELNITVKKVKVSDSSALKTQDRIDKSSIKFIFCGKTLDLDNVSSTDSAFTRMEAIRVFLETRLGYEVFAKAYQCIKGVSRLDEEIAVCKAVVKILGRENLNYFPVLIQLVSCESIHYS